MPWLSPPLEKGNLGDIQEVILNHPYPSSARQGFCCEAGSRDLFELSYAPYLSNSLNLKGVSLSPLGGRGQGEGGMQRPMKATPHPIYRII